MIVEVGFPPLVTIHSTNEQLTGDDVEDLEGLVEVAKLNLVSIAVGSNFSGFESKCFIRETSDKQDEIALVEKFLNYLEELAEVKIATMPSFISEAEEKLNLMFQKLKDDGAKKIQYQELYSFLRVLNNWKILEVYGFNSSKFDLPVLAAPLFHLLISRDEKPQVMKRGSRYFSIATEKLRFKDTLNYTAPCSYDKFLASWDTEQMKSIFPYSYFGSIEEMRFATEFPPHDAFENELNGNTPSLADYESAKTLFEQRKRLAESDPLKMNNMADWLSYYNELDVYPLVQAIEKCFASYAQYFGVCPFMSHSLPSMAEEAMFKFVGKDQPLVFSPNGKERQLHEQYRENVLGGLVNVHKRHVVTTDEIECPDIARRASNGEKYTSFIMLDFTSMYLSCQQKPMPCGPALVWEKSSCSLLKKKISIPNHSFVAQQWLCYRQVTGSYVVKVELFLNFYYKPKIALSIVEIFRHQKFFCS